MNEEYFFADVDLPFHFWVRERCGATVRWVLREAPQSDGAAGGADATSLEPPPISSAEP